MKKLPKKVTILGRVFTVKLVSSEVLANEVGQGSVGGMNYSRRLIWVQNDMSWDDTLVTYFHECVHAATFIVGLNQVTSRDLAEVWCETMANTFRDVFVKK